MNRIVTPTIPIKDLSGKSRTIAAINFFINFAVIAALYGFGVPTLINKIVRKDVAKEKSNQLPKINFSNEIIKRDMENRTALHLK